MTSPGEKLLIDRPTTDPYLYRLLAAISLGIALLNCAFAFNLRYQRLPNLQRVIANTKLDSIGRGGDWLLGHQYLLVVVTGLAAVISLAALCRPRRLHLSFAYLMNFAAIGASIAAEVAVTRVWTRILGRLMQ